MTRNRPAHNEHEANRKIAIQLKTIRPEGTSPMKPRKFIVTLWTLIISLLAIPNSDAEINSSSVTIDGHIYIAHKFITWYRGAEDVRYSFIIQNGKFRYTQKADWSHLGAPTYSLSVYSPDGIHLHSHRKMILRFKPSENDFDVTFDNWNTTHKTQFITYIDWADGGHGIRAAGGGIQADK